MHRPKRERVLAWLLLIQFAVGSVFFFNGSPIGVGSNLEVLLVIGVAVLLALAALLQFARGVRAWLWLAVGHFTLQVLDTPWLGVTWGIALKFRLTDSPPILQLNLVALSLALFAALLLRKSTTPAEADSVQRA